VALPREGDAMNAGPLRRALDWSWWLVMPAFAALVLRLDVERACAAPYELLPEITTVPLFAWALSALYLAGHAWLGAAWLVTALHADRMLPPWRSVRAYWIGRTWAIWLTLAIFALEYAPIPVWRILVRSVLRCG
jgi:hypothetical protein